MSSRCCIKPIATIITVGDFEAGIIGLKNAFEAVYASGIKDEEQLRSDLLAKVKEFGNYISPETESAYKAALFREYGKFVKQLQQNAGV